MLASLFDPFLEMFISLDSWRELVMAATGRWRNSAHWETRDREKSPAA
jgi:hypothetical protein